MSLPSSSPSATDDSSGQRNIASRTATWRRVQEELKSKVVLCDKFDWQPPPFLREPTAGDGVNDEILRHMAERDRWDGPEVEASWSSGAASKELKVIVGLDVSFSKAEGSNMACACLVALDFKSQQVQWEDFEVFPMVEPYVPGFLAFREAPALSLLLERSKNRSDRELAPQLAMVDGNGILHAHGFGLASHVGVLAGVPSIGVAKKLTALNEGWLKHVDRASKERFAHAGDWAPLFDDGGRVRGAVVRGGGDSCDPVYISQGHRISLSTAVAVVQACLRHRIPEPVRQADIRSRAKLRSLGI